VTPCACSHPVVYDAAVDRMGKMQGYKRSAGADNVTILHGREVRQVRRKAAREVTTFAARMLLWCVHVMLLHVTPCHTLSQRVAYHSMSHVTRHALTRCKVASAAGGMGFVLHLSLAGGSDAEGWTEQEIAEYVPHPPPLSSPYHERHVTPPPPPPPFMYDGWGHDSSRRWRKAQQLQQEGFRNFSEKFGASAFTLHHRFYFHTDKQARLWLAAEDGCEGVGPVLTQ